MGDSESRDDNLGELSDDEDEDDNEIFVRELKRAQRTLCEQFHIDSEVEIDIAQPDGTPFLSRALKAVLIKKKGFDPALLPPWISGNNVEQGDDNLLPGSRNRNRKLKHFRYQKMNKWSYQEELMVFSPIFCVCHH